MALLTEFCRACPADLDDEARANASDVTRAAALLPALAELMPAAVANQAALLRPFLACNSTSVRGAVLSAVGFVLQKVRGHCCGGRLVAAVCAAGAIDEQCSTTHHTHA